MRKGDNRKEGKKLRGKKKKKERKRWDGPCGRIIKKSVWKGPA